VKIKICGLFREQDIEYVNDAMVDYAGFVFAPSKRQVSRTQAASLRQRLAQGITPVGVFVNAPIEQIVSLYRDGIIDIAQLHGTEDEEYIARLYEASASGGREPIQVIKVIRSDKLEREGGIPATIAAYYLLDSGAGTGKTFNWNLINSLRLDKPWFMAGGINIANIKAAMELAPFAIDLSGGAETDGIKDKNKILQLTTMVRKGSI
jgi:phosphoribosylanthranilate isomerase